MTRRTLRGLSEKKLAAFQTFQVGNTCSFHAVSVSLQLLLGYQIDPMALAVEVDRQWRRWRFMRILPGWAVTPRMLARMVGYVARTRDLPVQASFQRGHIEMLIQTLANPDCIPIVTLTWLGHQVPPIYYGKSSENTNTITGAGGHIMLLAAHDPDHRSGDQLLTPWGFINPWVTNASQLFWMTDADFRKAWSFWIPLNGPNPLVLVCKTS